MQVPKFPEANHPLVRSLFHHSDQELLTLFQHHPDSGRYFVALFCRYNPMVYTIIRHSARSPVQAEYLFALTWRHIFYELGGLDPQNTSVPSAQASNTGNPGNSSPHFSLQGWLINQTALCINQTTLPPVESIHYSLQTASPPFWCYVEQALDRLLPISRLMILMAQTFHWSETRISAYLQAEGERISPAEVKVKLLEGYKLLETELPNDIQVIYLGEGGNNPFMGPELEDLSLEAI